MEPIAEAKARSSAFLFTGLKAGASTDF